MIDIQGDVILRDASAISERIVGNSAIIHCSRILISALIVDIYRGGDGFEMSYLQIV